MPNKITSLIKKYAGPDFAPRLKHMAMNAKGNLAGLAEDFWFDGPENPLTHIFRRNPNGLSVVSQGDKHNAPLEPANNNLWHAGWGDLAEKMWGEGYVLPGDAHISQRLVEPLGLNAQMSVLDLSAGLGQRALTMVTQYGVQVTGLETDPEIAVRGMARLIEQNKGRKASISSYDPATFKIKKGYDVIIQRELLYRIEAKGTFLKSLTGCTNKNAFVSFTDYVVEADQLNQPGIKTWMAFEKGSKPVGIVEMAEIWAQAGFHILNNEDLTPYYKKEIVEGLKRLASFLATQKRPDAATVLTIKQQMNQWAYRMMAFESGMRIFRFLATRQG